MTKKLALCGALLMQFVLGASCNGAVKEGMRETAKVPGRVSGPALGSGAASSGSSSADPGATAAASKDPGAGAATRDPSDPRVATTKCNAEAKDRAACDACCMEGWSFDEEWGRCACRITLRCKASGDDECMACCDALPRESGGHSATWDPEEGCTCAHRYFDPTIKAERCHADATEKNCEDCCEDGEMADGRCACPIPVDCPYGDDDPMDACVECCTKRGYVPKSWSSDEGCACSHRAGT